MHDVYELDVRPADDLDTGWLSEESIEYGTPPREWAWQPPDLFSRLPRIPTGFVVSAVLLVLVVAVGVSALHPSRRPAPAPNPSPVAFESPQQVALAQMEALANSTTGLQDYTIVDNVHPNCPQILVGGATQVATMAGVVERYQDGYTLKDSELGSELTGACSASLRFVNSAGTVLIVTVIAPPNSIKPFAITSLTDYAGARDVGTVVEGWRVEVGVEGARDSLIGETDLLAIATDARLRW